MADQTLRWKLTFFPFLLRVSPGFFLDRSVEEEPSLSILSHGHFEEAIFYFNIISCVFFLPSRACSNMKADPTPYYFFSATKRFDVESHRV